MKDVLSFAFLSISSCFISYVSAELTVYSTQGFNPTETAAGGAAAYTGAAAYDPTVLTAPGAPNPATTGFNINLNTNNPNGVSIVQRGDFFGFSVELSVADQIFGKNGSHVNPVFLNLLNNIQQRAGSVRIRVGGNSQERADMIQSGLPGGLTIQKYKDDVTNPTATPRILIGIDLIYAMANISHLVNAYWYVGIPFNDTTPRLQIHESADQILGKYLLGAQLGNEPDLYAAHGAFRNATYNETNYMADYQLFMNAIDADPNISNKSNIVGPSICCGLTNGWKPEDLWNVGYLDTFNSRLAEIAVEHYPHDNCKIAGSIQDPQALLGTDYTQHGAVVTLSAPYYNTGNLAQQHGKPFIMMETNTASCSGFPGLSNSFAATLWAIDHSLQMAAVNFTGAMFHLGGQNAYYNPFTPPPTNQSRFRNWSTGSVYYSALAVAEVFGTTGKAQIQDLQVNGNNGNTPAYGIWEDNAPARVAIINYATDPSHGNDFTVQLQIGGGGTNQPVGTLNQVKVKYMRSPNNTVVDLSNYGFTWAGQTMGPNFQVDGTMKGQENTTTVTCQNNVCPIWVPAPSFALVFLTDQAYSESTPPDSAATATFATTAFTALRNTATVDQAVLSTSNGRGGANNQLGATSFGSNSPGVSLTLSQRQNFIVGVSVVFWTMVWAGARMFW